VGPVEPARDVVAFAWLLAVCSWYRGTTPPAWLAVCFGTGTPLLLGSGKSGRCFALSAARPSTLDFFALLRRPEPPTPCSSSTPFTSSEFRPLRRRWGVGGNPVLGMWRNYSTALKLACERNPIGCNRA